MFSIQLVTENGSWPKEPLSATPADLIAYCEYAQAPQAVIDKESAQIAQEIRSVGQKLLDNIRVSRNFSEEILGKLRKILGCRDDLEATCTACAVWLIAIDLQNDLASYSPALQKVNLKTTRRLRDEANGVLTLDAALVQWGIIEGINYLPVMELAIKSLESVDIRTGLSDVLLALESLSARLNGLACEAHL